MSEFKFDYDKFRRAAQQAIKETLKMQNKCYFHVDDNGKILEPVMIGNTRIEVTNFEVLDGVNHFDWCIEPKITIEGYIKAGNDKDFVPPFDQKITRIIYNGPCTIVFWNDDAKTVVKRSEDDKPDRKVALIYAIAKKKFGTMSQVHKAVDRFAKSNAQRIAILNYIVAQDGFDVDELLNSGRIHYEGESTEIWYC